MARCSRRTAIASGSAPASTRCRSGTGRSSRRRSRRTNIRCTRSPSGRCRCITAGARRMPGCGRSWPATDSTCTGEPRRPWASPTATRSRSRARTAVPRPGSASWSGCAENTVWTWNAIGKRAGAWGLAPDAPEVTSGFLLNQVIGERLPAADGYTHANADPITGQAAWFDLRVRVRRSAEAGAPARPDFATARASMTEYAPVDPGPEAARPGDRSRHLRRLPCLRHGVPVLERPGLSRPAGGHRARMARTRKVRG